MVNKLLLILFEDVVDISLLGFYYVYCVIYKYTDTQWYLIFK